jgi:phospholipid-binding lipoprotein MlaA
MLSNEESRAGGRLMARLIAFCCLALLPAMVVYAEETADPLEPANRKVFSFNDALDRWIVKPVARGYDKLPDPIQRGLHNMFENLETPGTAINQFLQGKPNEGMSDLTRFLANSTFGLFGWFDVATKGGVPKHEEDFGQTFAVWGIGSGPFVMLPGLGPSTTTDTVGNVLDWFTNPVNLINPERDRYIVRGVDLIDTRAELLSVEQLMSGDRYLFMRDAYLQRREFLINDGVVEEDPFLEGFEDDYEDAAPDAPEAGASDGTF